MIRRNLSPHGQGVRRLDLSRSSVSFEGAFGRIFRALAPAEFGTTDAENSKQSEALRKCNGGKE